MVLYFWLMIHFLIFLISGSTSFFPLRNGDFFPLTTIGGRVEIPFKDKAISNLFCEAISIWHESHPYSIRKKSIVFYTCVIQSFPPPHWLLALHNWFDATLPIVFVKGIHSQQGPDPYFIVCVILKRIWHNFLLNSDKRWNRCGLHSVVRYYVPSRVNKSEETKTVRF